MSFDTLLSKYFDDPCHCKRCGDVLPFIHPVDHLCDACFDRDLLELVQKIAEQLKEERNGEKAALTEVFHNIP